MAIHAWWYVSPSTYMEAKNIFGFFSIVASTNYNYSNELTIFNILLHIDISISYLSLFLNKHLLHQMTDWRSVWSAPIRPINLWISHHNLNSVNLRSQRVIATIPTHGPDGSIFQQWTTLVQLAVKDRWAGNSSLPFVPSCAWYPSLSVRACATHQPVTTSHSARLFSLLLW